MSQNKIGQKKKIKYKNEIIEGTFVTNESIEFYTHDGEKFFLYVDENGALTNVPPANIMASEQSEDIPSDLEITSSSYPSVPCVEPIEPTETAEASITQFAQPAQPAAKPAQAPVSAEPIQAKKNKMKTNGKNIVPKEVSIQKSGDKKSKSKKFMALIAYGIAVVICLIIAAGAVANLQAEVTIVRLKANKLAGDVVSEADVEPFNMLKKTYEDLSKVTYVAKDKVTVKKPMLLWSEKEKYFGTTMTTDKPVTYYATSYVQAGQCLTADHLTTEKIVRNPWLADVPDGYEVYAMPFNPADVDARLLYPGTCLRARLVLAANAEEVGDNKGLESETMTDEKANTEDKDKDKDKDKDTKPTDKKPGVLPEEESKIPESDSKVGQDVTAKIDTTGEEMLGTNEASLLAMLAAGQNVKLPISMVVFEKLTAIDMLNSSNESIFDIYMALLKLPVEERAAQLETTVDGDITDFQKKVTPTQLVFALTREQADRMSQFENLDGGVIKYTILPQKDENGELVNELVEINGMINKTIEAAVKESQQAK